VLNFPALEQRSGEQAACIVEHQFSSRLCICLVHQRSMPATLALSVGSDRHACGVLVRLFVPPTETAPSKTLLIMSALHEMSHACRMMMQSMQHEEGAWGTPDTYQIVSPYDGVRAEIGFYVEQAVTGLWHPNTVRFAYVGGDCRFVVGLGNSPGVIFVAHDRFWEAILRSFDAVIDGNNLHPTWTAFATLTWNCYPLWVERAFHRGYPSASGRPACGLYG